MYMKQCVYVFSICISRKDNMDYIKLLHQHYHFQFPEGRETVHTAL